MALKWTPKAEADLKEIFGHVSTNFDKALAKKVVTSLIDHTESVLSSNPLAGRILTSNPLFSYLVIDGNRVFYCENPRDKCLYVVYVQARSTLFQSERVNRGAE